MPQNPSHTISTLTDINISDLDRVEMSTYRAESTGGWLLIYFTTPPSMLTIDQGRLSSWTWLPEMSLSSTLLPLGPRHSRAEEVGYLIYLTTY